MEKDQYFNLLNISQSFILQISMDTYLSGYPDWFTGNHLSEWSEMKSI